MALDATKVQFYSGYTIDKIVGSYSGTQTVAGSGGSATVTIPSNILLSQFFFYGQFTIDGTNFYPFDSLFYATGALGTAITGDLYANTTSLFAYFINNDSVSHDFTYKIVAVVPSPNTALPEPTAISQKISFNTNYNYPKIYIDSSQNVAINNTTNTLVTIPHNLGYIPYVRLWVGKGQNIYNATDNTFGLSPAICETQIDNNNLYVWITDTAISETVTLYYRIYYDN